MTLAVLVAVDQAAQAVTIDELAEANRLYHEGAMSAAAGRARAANGAAGLALAAKATLVKAVYSAPPDAREALLQQAVRDAEAALVLEPDYVPALQSLAIALGHLADRDDAISAHLKGYAARGRQLLDRGLALAPNDPWSHGLLGIWHLQIVRRADHALARSLYGASLEEGLRACARAEALGPGELALRLGCALSRLQVDPDAHRQSAITTLSTLSALPARDAAERLARRRAQRLLKELRDPG